MKFRIIGSVAAALLSVGAVVPAQAASTNNLPAFDFAAGEILVKYAAGVSAVAADGSPTGENAAGVAIADTADLGQGWHKLTLDGSATQESTWSAIQRLDQDTRILAIDVNRVISPASVPTASTIATAIKPATAARSLKVADAFTAATPTVARLKLTWSAPSNLGSAKLVGYRIWQKTVTTGWSIVAGNTKTKATSLTLAKGLVAATAYQFRVAALTQSGATIKQGAYSAVASGSATTTPSAPVLTSSLNVTNRDAIVTWLAQTPAQAGAVDTKYSVQATATTGATATCVTASNTCELTGLADGVSYKIAVIATNKRGSAQSSPGFTAQDAYYGKLWFLWSEHGVNVPAAWNQTIGNKSIVVAVIDTGITKHPDLDSQVLPGYDFVSDAASARDGNGWDSDATDEGDYTGAISSSWHGTHVAGIIGAAANETGVIGVAPGVKIQPVRVLGSEGGKTEDLVAGLKWAAGLQVTDVNGNKVPLNPTPAKVINISMGTDSATPCRLNGQTLGITEEALALVKAAGATTITAAGNFNMPAYYSYPGNCYPTLNVGATSFSGDRAVYSNYSVLDSASGEMVGVDLSAPGGDHTDFVGAPDGTTGRILSTRNDGKTTIGTYSYDYEEGTSMAAPVVTGVVALIYSIKPSITFEDVWLKAVQPTLTPFGPLTQCAQKKTCGGGIVNAGAAVTKTLTLP